MQLTSLLMTPMLARWKMPFLLRMSSLITVLLASGFNRYSLLRMMVGFTMAPKCNLPLDFDYFTDIFLLTSVFLNVG